MVALLDVGLYLSILLLPQLVLNPFLKKCATLWPAKGLPKPSKDSRGRYFLVLQQWGLGLAASCTQPERLKKKHVSHGVHRTVPFHGIVLLYWPRQAVNGKDKSIAPSRPTSTTFSFNAPTTSCVARAISPRVFC